MQWDLVEVRPEADYCLFVRFRDGLSGCVRLDPRAFTGVLAPFGDVEFFNSVFIDSGDPAWPGDIDLPPDAIDSELVRPSL